MVFKVAQHSLVEKARIVEALRTKEGEDSEFAVWMLGRLNSPSQSDELGSGSLELDDLLDILKTDDDRTIARMWAGGANHTQIATHLGVDDAAVRQRWHRIRQTLQDGLAERRA